MAGQWVGSQHSPNPAPSYFGSSELANNTPYALLPAAWQERLGSKMEQEDTIVWHWEQPQPVFEPQQLRESFRDKQGELQSWAAEGCTESCLFFFYIFFKKKNL